MQLIQIKQCKAWCASQHFWMNYEGLWVVVIVAVVLTSCYIFSKAYENGWFGIRDAVSESAALKIIDLSVLFCVVSLLGFIIWVLFWFQPQYASEFFHNYSSIGAENITDFAKVWGMYS